MKAGCNRASACGSTVPPFPSQLLLEVAEKSKGTFRTVQKKRQDENLQRSALCGRFTNNHVGIANDDDGDDDDDERRCLNDDPHVRGCACRDKKSMLLCMSL